jgi:exonuclease III
MFTDPTLHDRLVRCEVLDRPLVREVSDHAPLVAEFAG